MNEEKTWTLKALDLNACPFYTKGDSLRVQMPGVFGNSELGSNRMQMCSMPIATFIPTAMEGIQKQGEFEAGYKSCSCRWNFCESKIVTELTKTADEGLISDGQMSKPFLEQMPADVAEAFRDRATPMRFQAGDIVLEGNVASTLFHVIVKGMVRIANRGNDGRVMELSVLRKGDCFGEMSILTGAATSSQVDAVEDCLTLAISKKDFHKLLNEFPILSILLYRMLSKRIKASNQKLAQLMSPGLSGDLHFFPFVDLTQTVMTAHMSGTLVIEHAPVRARFGFFEGGLIYGIVGNMQGTDAIDEVVRWREGSFRFLADEKSAERNLSGDTMVLLLEALRRMDESTMMEKSP